MALSAAILFYDWHHNGNPLSPYAMLALVLVGLIAWITVADEKVVAIIGTS